MPIYLIHPKNFHQHGPPWQALNCFSGLSTTSLGHVKWHMRERERERERESQNAKPPVWVGVINIQHNYHYSAHLFKLHAKHAHSCWLWHIIISSLKYSTYPMCKWLGQGTWTKPELMERDHGPYCDPKLARAHLIYRHINSNPIKSLQKIRHK